MQSVRRWISVCDVSEFRKVYRDYNGEYIIVNKRALAKRIHMQLAKPKQNRVYIDKKNIALVKLK